MAVDVVVGGLLGDGGFAVLLELAQDLLADEGTEQSCAAQDVGTGIVDGGEDEGRGVDRSDRAGEEGGVSTLGRAVGARLGGDAFGVGGEAAGIEVRDAEK